LRDSLFVAADDYAAYSPGRPDEVSRPSRQRYRICGPFSTPIWSFDKPGGHSSATQRVSAGTTPSPALWQPSDHVAAARSVLAIIPDGATVAASNSLAPQLTGRTEVSLFGILPFQTSKPEFIVADPSIAHQFPLDEDALTTLVTSAEGTGYRVIDASDGVILLIRK
jgi:hypothetical protein